MQRSGLLRLWLILLLLAVAEATPQAHNKRDSSHPPYLSSSSRLNPVRSFGLFSYSRYPAQLGPYDPLLGVRDVILHQGVADTSAVSVASAQSGSQVSGPTRWDGSERDLGTDHVAGQVIWRHDLHEAVKRCEIEGLRRRQDDAGEMVADDVELDGEDTVGETSGEDAGGEGEASDDTDTGLDTSSNIGDGDTSGEIPAAEDETSGSTPDSAWQESDSGEAVSTAQPEDVIAEPTTTDESAAIDSDSPQPLQLVVPAIGIPTAITVTVTELTSPTSTEQLASEVSPTMTSTTTQNSVSDDPAPASTTAAAQSLPSSPLTEGTWGSEVDWEWVDDDGTPMDDCDWPGTTPLLSASPSPTSAATGAAISPQSIPATTTGFTGSQAASVGNAEAGPERHRRDIPSLAFRLQEEIRARLRPADLTKRRKHDSDDDQSEYADADEGAGSGGRYGGSGGKGKFSGGWNEEDDSRGRTGHSKSDKGQYFDDEDDRNHSASPGRGSGSSPHSKPKEDDDEGIAPSRPKQAVGAVKPSAKAGAAPVTTAMDCTSLKVLFSAMGGDNWLNKAGWSDGSGDCCAWFGVICQVPLAARGWRDDYGDGHAKSRNKGNNQDSWSDEDDGADDWRGGHAKSSSAGGKWSGTSDREDGDRGSGDSDADMTGDSVDDDVASEAGVSVKAANADVGGDHRSERVVALNLANNGLTGALPESLFALTALARM